VPGIDFSHDPLLQGRLFAYADSQLSRLGGPNGHELPINRGICPVHNFQRDGRHRLLLNKGAVGYEPNTLGNGSEFRADGGQQGFQSYAEDVEPPKVRRRSAGFDDHFSQATLFWNSQCAWEKEHIVAAFQFELSRVETVAIRQRVVDTLAHVDAKLARKVAEDYPDIEFEDRIIDNLCNQLVSRPEEYDVIVLPNLYGDIVSDLCAGMIGGLGLAPGGNIGTAAAMFEATHGSAPKYKGQNKVNPTALMLSGVLMLRHLGERAAADRLEGAIATVIKRGEKVTYDLKPNRDDPSAVGTSQFADAVIEEMSA